MIIDERKITVGEVCEGYFNDAEEGVVGYNDRLDIRPKYQREFVYKDAQRDEVIRTVLKGLPLNVIYWCKTGDDTYEVLDGQQRTISLCEYVDGSFSVKSPFSLLATSVNVANLSTYLPDFIPKCSKRENGASTDNAERLSLPVFTIISCVRLPLIAATEILVGLFAT